MDTYALHLAMVALVGASFVVVSAYYMHCKILSQLLKFARAVKREWATAKGGDKDSGVGASFVVVSAYYMHCKILSQLLKFAQAVKREWATAKGGNKDSGVGRDDEPKRRSSLRRGHQQHSRWKEARYYRCGGGLASLLDVILAT